MKIDRLVSIIMILLDQKRVGAQALADMFEVSTRTIYRDIDAINLAGIPIRSTSGAGGGFEILPNYKVEKNVFTVDDLTAILMGLYRISDLVRGDELIHALAKVKRFIPAERAKDIELRANQIYIDLSPWIGNKNTERYLATIKTALQQNKTLSFDYADRYGNPTARTADPYRLILKNNRWYLQAYCHVRNDFRLFRLSRMSDLHMHKQCFPPREVPPPQLDFPDIETLQTKIVLRVHRSVLDRVLDFCTRDDISSDVDEYSIVRFPFIENDYYYDMLLSFGARCECLEPTHVRTEIQRRLQSILALYQNGKFVGDVQNAAVANPSTSTERQTPPQNSKCP